MARITLALLAVTLAASAARAQAPQVREGDIVFQTSRSRQSAIIAEVTQSQWTHMGVVFFVDGEPFVLHASRSVHWTPWEEWVEAGVERRVLIRRLAQPLSAQALERLRAAATSYLGRPYDARFEWGDERLYCSEFAYRVYERALGISLVTPQRWSQITLTARARALARRRLGRLPRASEQIVTPVAIAESPLLVAPR